MDNAKKLLMDEAIKLADNNLNSTINGPFGAIIVKNNIIVGRGANSVASTNDPTAHAEVNAIRDACKNLNTFDLESCDIYTSCEPCPMCLGAIYWAHIKNIYYACHKKDAAEAGFDDAFIYNEFDLAIDKRSIPATQINQEDAKKIFVKWIDKQDKICY
ncbi:MAG: nucleoside deaminase [Bacteroidota bacterium]